MFFGQGVSTSVDIWALGIVLLHMIFVHPPFMELDEAQYMMQICLQRKTPDVPDFVDSDVQALLQACLNFEAENRPSANDLQKITAKLRPGKLFCLILITVSFHSRMNL